MSEKSFPIVRIFDRAIRWSNGKKDGHTDVQRYGETRDPSLLVEIPGMRPVTFHTRRLTRSQMRDLEGLSTEPLKREVAFAYGVTAIDRADQRTVRPTGDRWTSEEMDAEGLDFASVEDVGAVILQRSRLPFDWPAYFVAPPSSARASALLLFPTAGQSPADAPPSSSAPAAPSGT